MIWMLLLGTISADIGALSGPETAAVERDVAAMNGKLKNWRAALKMGGGTLTCITRTSSGDAQIDDAACQAMSGCAMAFGPQMVAVSDPSISQDKRKELNKKLNSEVSACVADRRQALFRSLAERRVREATERHNAAN